MPECAVCKSALPDDAKFCLECGKPQASVATLSEFEIGKMAALATIKKDILTWFGGTATVIGAVFAALTYFGINETVKVSVSEEIKRSFSAIKTK